MTVPPRPGAGVPVRRGRSRQLLLVPLSVAALSFVLVAVLVVTSSRAAFVAQTDNATNSVSSAGITLADNDSGTAMFNNVTGLMPGSPIDRCITVTWTGTADPLPVKLYVSGAPTGNLATYLDLTIDVGPATGNALGDCTGFTSTSTIYTAGTLAGFAGAYTGYAGGLDTTWDPSTTSPESRTFRFRVAVQSAASAQNQTTTFGFTWETQTP